MAQLMSAGPRPGAGSAFWHQGDNLETARQLWCETDIPASVIALQLGCTKNAVLGKAHREHWRERQPKQKPLAPPNPFAALDATSCRWPVGHPGEANFHFCGAAAIPGRPYCATHRAIAIGHARSG